MWFLFNLYFEVNGVFSLLICIAFSGQIGNPDGPFFYLFIRCHDNTPPTVLHLAIIHVERLCIVYFLSRHSKTMWQPQLGIGSV